MEEKAVTAEGLASLPIPPPSSPEHFVLVHGVGHGAWCWFKLRRLLECSGHKVTCLDLAGAGMDQSDPNAVLSFQDYNRPLLEFMSRLPENEKVVLVGHSAGGLSVTQATREFPNKIAAAIYIAATMLRSGFQSEEDIKDAVPDLSRYGDVLELTFASGLDSPPTSAYLNQKFQREILYQLSPIEDSMLASMLLRPWPASTVMLGARFEGGDEAAADEVRRVYVKTTQDNMVRPEQQEAMMRRWPPSEVVLLETDHSPFFSAPEKLLHVLVKTSGRLKKTRLQSTENYAPDEEYSKGNVP